MADDLAVVRTGEKRGAAFKVSRRLPHTSTLCALLRTIRKMYEEG
jgi:hypothetical protein